MISPFRFLVLLPLVAVYAGEECPTGDDDTPTATPAPFVDCSDQARDFWAYDFSVMPPGSQQVSATCRLEGPHAYVYVADDQWNVTVTADDVEVFLDTFENRAPDGALDPFIGLYGNDVVVFGEPPDALDNDPKVYLLLMDFEDYVSSDGEVFQFDGYFGSMDQYPDEEIQRQTLGRYHSNEVEIVYLNSRIRPITSAPTLSVLAHEFQHMIAWNYDESEEAWMSESLAEVAMIINGLYTDEPWVRDYASWPGYPLVYTGSPNYGACLLWGMYLYEQVGQDFMLEVESEQRDGITGLDRALASFGIDETFQGLFADWMMANLVDQPDSGRYGYQFADLPEFARQDLLINAGDSYDGEVYPFGVDYLDIFPRLDTATLEIATDAPLADRIWLVRWEAGQVADMSLLGDDDSSDPVTIDLVADSSNTAWTIAISFVDETVAGDTSQTMGYSVTLR